MVLVSATPDGDSAVLAAVLHSVSRGTYGECLDRVKAMTQARRRELVRRALARMEFYDFPLREFEHADLTFDLVVSASCFAQLKRHRMATLTVQAYDPALGVTVPDSVRAVGAEAGFRRLIERTGEVHGTLSGKVGPAADYILTNAHRRRVLLKLNVRELYHLSRLRQDATAQWEIRVVAGEMSRLAKRALPLSCLLLGGKDAYPEVYRRVFGRPPRMVPPSIFQ